MKKAIQKQEWGEGVKHGDDNYKMRGGNVVQPKITSFHLKPGSTLLAAAACKATYFVMFKTLINKVRYTKQLNCDINI